MLRLDMSADNLVVIELAEGVEVDCQRATTDFVLDLIAESRADREKVDGDIDAEEDQSRSRFARLMAQRGIVAWRGVGDVAGTPIEPSPETIDALMDNYPAFAVFEREYVTPALVMVDEGNGFAVLRSGTSGAAPTTATGAKPNAKTARKRQTSRKH